MKFALLSLLLGALSYCVSAKNIVDVAVDDGSFNTLAAALGAADLVDTLSTGGPFTVLAPTDNAFAKLPVGFVEYLLEPEQKDALTSILTYHVLDSAVPGATVLSLIGDSATTLNGEAIDITLSGYVLEVNDATVIFADVIADNGIIHVINNVLVPPSLGPVPQDIYDTAKGAGSFMTLLAAVDAAGLTDTVLKTPGPYTVLAPNDDAFAKLPNGTVEALLGDIPTLTSILSYHVISGRVMAETVVTLDEATTLNGQTIDIMVDDMGSVLLNNSTKVIATDIMASNGVIHVIDSVLIPADETDGGEGAPADLYGTAVSAGMFTTLLAAVDAAGLTAVLQSAPGPYTVLAPTDDAFAALPEGTLDALLADTTALTEVLTYHVLEGSVMADTVVTLDQATALNGKTISIMVDENGNVVLNDSAQVTATDIMASNGVIHIIDAVLIPPADETDPLPDIIDTATSAGVFTTLLAAVDAAGLTETLKSDGPFTVLAPTDTAFDALPEGTVEALLADTEALTDVLTYHVLEGSVKAETVVTLDQATALNGKIIDIMVVDGTVVLNNSTQVTTTDIMVSNGVIHIIDGVLIPPE